MGCHLAGLTLDSMGPVVGLLGFVHIAGALWYLHKENGAPVLADKAVLPGKIVSCGRDFPMEFLTESFQGTKMTVIRNVTTPGERCQSEPVSRAWCCVRVVSVLCP